MFSQQFVRGVLLSTWCLATALLAQTQRGQIVGEVTDPSGSVLAGAKLEALNQATGVRSETVSGANGVFTFTLLDHGKYNIKVAFPGFAATTLSGVEVAAATTTTANIVMKLSSVAEEVTVQATGAVLESTTSVIGAGIDEDLKRELPLPVAGGKRSASRYILTSPTVNPTGQLTIGGGRTNSHELLIDGQTADVQSSEIGSSGQLPSVENISEFRMILNSMPAEYGRSSGGMTILATKSGSNEYHGAAYWYLRNEKLDARPWQAATRNVRKQNEYGIAAGGPVLIPKLYNGRNRTFFWANYTGYKDRQAAASGILSLPTQGMRSGDFSAADLPPIFDRLARTTDAQGNVRFQQFPGNRIPANRLSGVSTFFFGALPVPNLPGSVNNFVGSSRGVTDNHDFGVRGDHNFTENDRLSGFYQYTNAALFNGSILGDTFGNTNQNYTHRVRMDWSHIFRPNLIQQVLLGVTRNPLASTSNNFGQDLGAKAGIKGTLDPNCPETWIDYPSGFVICAALPGPQNSTANTVTTANYSLQWIRGDHSMKFGGQLIRYNQNRLPLGGPFQASAAGTFTFGNPLGGQRANTSNTDNTGGNPWADFYLGWPQGAIVGAPQIVGNRETYLAFFAQDDWRVTRRLTLNLGLRWDINLPYTEVQGRITGFDPNRPNPGATGINGALVFYGEGQGRTGSNRPGEIRWGNLAPRLGLAYQIDSKTVFRGFVGLIYQGIQNANANFADRTGFFTQAAIPPTVDPFSVYYSWDTRFPTEILGLDRFPNTDPTLKNNQAVTYQRPKGLGDPPELYMASAGFQREIPFGMVVEATWLYNGMRHAHDHLPINQLNPQYWNLGTLLNRPLNSPEVQARGFRKPFPEFDDNLPLFRSLLPFPQYSGVTEDASNHTTSTYHAAVFKVQKRFSAGLTFLGSYTISKYISDTTWAPGAFGSSPRDSYNRRLEKAVQRFDIPQRVVLAYSYDLPFGKGRKLVSGAPRAVDAIIGGWNIAGLQSYMSGTPVGLGGGLSVGIPTIGTRANVNSAVPLRSGISCGEIEFGNPQRNYLFNAGNPEQAARTGRPLAFLPQGDFQIGNMPNVHPSARQCGILNEDISITKGFRIVERVRVRFGAEMFNIFNRHTWEYGTSGGNVAASNFGEVLPTQPNGPRQIQMKLRLEW